MPDTYGRVGRDAWEAMKAYFDYAIEHKASGSAHDGYLRRLDAEVLQALDIPLYEHEARYLPRTELPPATGG